MTRYDRHCLARLSAMFGLACAVLALVFWVNQAVVLSGRVIGGGQSLEVLAELTALTLPAVIRSAIPLAAFAAAVMVASRMRTDSETVAMQAAGCSGLRMLRPALVFGVMCALLLSLIVHGLLPVSRARLDLRTAEASEDLSGLLLTEGAFVHPSDGITFYVSRIEDDGALTDIYLSDRRGPEQSVAYTARSAVLTSGPRGPTLVMFDGLAQTLEGDGRLFTTRFEEFAYDVAALTGSNAHDGPGLKGTPSHALIMGGLDREAWHELHARTAQPALALMCAALGFAALGLGPHTRLGLWRQALLAAGLLIVLKLLEGALRDPILEVAWLWPLHYGPAALGLAAALAMTRPDAWPRLGRRGVA